VAGAGGRSGVRAPEGPGAPGPPGLRRAGGRGVRGGEGTDTPCHTANALPSSAWPGSFPARRTSRPSGNWSARAAPRSARCRPGAGFSSRRGPVTPKRAARTASIRIAGASSIVRPFRRRPSMTCRGPAARTRPPLPPRPARRNPGLRRRPPGGGGPQPDRRHPRQHRPAHREGLGPRARLAGPDHRGASPSPVSGERRLPPAETPHPLNRFVAGLPAGLLARALRLAAVPDPGCRLRLLAVCPQARRRRTARPSRRRHAGRRRLAPRLPLHPDGVLAAPRPLAQRPLRALRRAGRRVGGGRGRRRLRPQASRRGPPGR